MKIKEKAKLYLQKLQALPDNRKKIIIAVIAGACAVILFFFWVNNTLKNISKINNNLQGIQLPAIEDVNKTGIETSNWKVEEDKDNGFAISYPADWQSNTANIKNVWDDKIFCPQSDEACNDGQHEIYLMIYKEKPESTGEQYLGFNPVTKLYFYISPAPQADQEILQTMVNSFKFINQ